MILATTSQLIVESLDADGQRELGIAVSSANSTYVDGLSPETRVPAQVSAEGVTIPENVPDDVRVL